MNDQATQTSPSDAMVTGLFHDRESTERAYNGLRQRGYTDDEINMVMSDETRNNYYTLNTDIGNPALEGGGVGSAVGGTIGAIVGGIAAIGTNLILPGLGLIIWGPLAAALAGAGAGGIAGGLIGALLGWGISDETAKVYVEGIKSGGVVIGVKPRTAEDADFLEREWKNQPVIAGS